jgi:hypothetical protein
VSKTHSATDKFQKLAAKFLAKPGVTVGSGKRGFGSSALQVNGKIFAMVSSKGCFVVKLPKNRVEALTASGDGTPFDPGHGRVMKEWFEVGSLSPKMSWSALAAEAFEFVGSQRKAP